MLSFFVSLMWGILVVIVIEKSCVIELRSSITTTITITIFNNLVYPLFY